ncbi:5090_t:CDS:2 [Gigaspora rosea]|nr:5090_t:CDS:2 [Gigaspora rosea]
MGAFTSFTLLPSFSSSSLNFNLLSSSSCCWFLVARAVAAASIIFGIALSDEPQPTKSEYTILRSTWTIPINCNEEDFISIGQNKRDEEKNEMNNNPIGVILIPR